MTARSGAPCEPVDLDKAKAVAFELIAHMKANGVRRMRLGDLEVELDPAAQYLDGAGAGDEPDAVQAQDTPEERAAKIASGKCVFSGCTDSANFLGQPYCRKHGRMGLAGVELS